MHIERVPFTYPIYKLNYFGELTRNLRELAAFKNMLLAGRCGRFWYNNMDHSIGQGLTMSDKILKGQILSADRHHRSRVLGGRFRGRVGGGTAERRRRAEADRGRVVSARIALRILPSGGRAWRHAALALWASVALVACGGDSPNSPTPNPGNPSPTVSSVAPATGTTLGGTTVTVTGTNFAAGATVTIGGTAATNVAVQNATTLTADTPQHAAGAADVSVTVAGRSGSMASAFTFVAPAASTNQPPAISGITTRSAAARDAVALRRSRRDADRHGHGHRRRDADRSAEVRVDGRVRRDQRHRPRGHAGAPQRRRRRRPKSACR